MNYTDNNNRKLLHRSIIGSLPHNLHHGGVNQSSCTESTKAMDKGDQTYSPSKLTIAVTTQATIVLHLCVIACIHIMSVNAEGNPSNTTTNDKSWDDVILSQEFIGKFPNKWTVLDYTFFGVTILLALELLNIVVKYGSRNGLFTGNSNKKQIPVRGKHLDDLRPIDYLFISMNKAATPPFVYFLMRYLYFEENSVWSINSLSLRNTLVPLPFLYVIYDFFYTILHWALHIQSVYKYIHKHHHTQKAPSRANVDAVNVHPVEFFLGEYNHLLAVFIWCKCLHQDLHVACVVLFLLIGGVLTAWNHTRFDIVYSLNGMVTFFDSKYHDVHHRIPQCNYGQYIMLWDLVFGTFRPYNHNDKVNPKAQLDPTTGKSYEYLELRASKRH